MRKKDSNRLFNTIAPVYGLFFSRQRARYKTIVADMGKHLDWPAFERAVDVGCGTGVLCSVLSEQGLNMTGVDPAWKMIRFARNRQENRDVRFVQASALEGLPFDDKAFDLSFASYVAHGLQKEERKRLYTEMSRVSKNKVIIYDYNQNRSLLTTVVEWLEHGDYFRFIREAETEMNDCVAEMNDCFSDVTVVNVDTRAAWYICTPR